MTSLPIDHVLDAIVGSLQEQPNLVIVAPPGAGKTTAVPLALLDCAWREGQILLLSPRRIAARAAAERMAEMIGERVGETVGYATRMESRHGARTQILVMTEGIFRNRIIADPELGGVSAVLFDEIHERSLDSDFGLALALEAQAAFRPDLRLLAMSATVEGSAFSTLMGDAPVVESQGRRYPLELRHLGRDASLPVEQSMASAIRQALSNSDGDILAFLPGVREVERTAERLAGRVAGAHVLPLHGTLSPDEQRRALGPAPDGKRKILLATNIAETSLTIDGVRIVVDSGLMRRARYDVAADTSRLVTERASQASVTQRAGRAARQAPGIAYRLWEEAATGGLARYDPPEIVNADLASLRLDCAQWGEADPKKLAWLDPPPDSALAEAKRKLRSLNAIDEEGNITPHGRRISQLPLPPELGAMILIAADGGQQELAARIAILLQEQGLGGREIDIEQRLNRWRGERGQRAQRMRQLADKLGRMVRVEREDGGTAAPPCSIGGLVAQAFPLKLARRRGSAGQDYLSVGGRAFALDPASALVSSEWLAVAEVRESAGKAHIVAAAAIEAAEVEAIFIERIVEHKSVRHDAGSDRLIATRGRRLGAVRISGGPDDKPDPSEIATALLESVRRHGLDLLPWSGRTSAWRVRAAYAGIEAVSDDALLARADEWLAPLLTGCRRLSDISASRLDDAIGALLEWNERSRIDEIAPELFVSPAGTGHEIDYSAEAGPTVQLRVQALYGLATHPTIGRDRIPLVLELTSPAGRPVQTTRDLPGFWAGSWHDVARDMRGRYPKHHWPDDPTAATADLATKRKQGI